MPNGTRRFRVEDIFAHKLLSALTASADGRRVAFLATQPDLKTNKVVSEVWAWEEGKGTWQVTFGGKAAAPRFSPKDGRLAFLSDRVGEKQQVFVMAPALCEGRKVTSMEEGVADFRWSPDGRRIAFLALADKTPQEKKAADEKRDWLTVDADERKRRLWVVDALGQGKPVQVSADGEFVTALAWTPDGGAIVYVACPRAITDSQFYETSLTVCRADGRGRRKICPLLRHEGPIHVSADARRALLSESFGPLDQWHGVAKVVDLRTGRKQLVASGFDLKGVNAQWLSEDEVLFECEAGTNWRLYVCRVGGRPRALDTGEGVAAQSAVSRSMAVSAMCPTGVSPVVFYIHSRAGQPDELCVLSLRGEGVLCGEGVSPLRAEGILPSVSSSSSSSSSAAASSSSSRRKMQTEEEREEARGRDPYGQAAHGTQGQDALATTLTNLNRSVARIRQAACEIVRWKSGGRDVEGILYLPSAPGAKRPHPLIVMPHGGPYGASSDSYNGSVVPNIYCAAGYACFLPNFRGSTGYGRLFTRAIVRDWGEGPFTDIMAGVDSLIRRGLADGKRLAVFGGSYGGYMTCWTIAHTHRFRCAVAVAAVTDCISEWSSADIPTFMIYSSGGTWPAYDAPFWRDQSPIHHVDKVKTPTLIITGDSDPRVPPNQSHEFYRALKLRGVKTRLVLYPREPHGLAEPRHRAHYFQEILEWIDEHVKK